MSALPMILLRVTGALAILCSAFGFWCNALSMLAAISGAFSTAEVLKDAPYFYPAFYTMSAICIVCYVLLAVFGIQFVRGNPERALAFSVLLVFEIAYVVAISSFAST